MNARTRLTRWLKRRPTPARRGGAVMEMGICFSMLMALSFGAVEFGDAYFKKNTMQGAAREGARLAITSSATTTTVQNAVKAVMDAAGISGLGTKYTVTITDTNNATVDPSTAVAGTAIKVTVSADWGQVGMRPLGILSSTKKITGTAVMRKES